MKQYTNRQVIMISDIQADSLRKLSKFVNVSQFIRQAIKEKLAKDWKEIKQPKNKTKTPF